MKKCPNQNYGDMLCPYALSEKSPLPCFATQEQCDEYRKIKESKETDGNTRRES